MSYWLLTYDLAADYLERRGEFRSVHLGLAADARDRGELLLAGAAGEPIDTAVLVFTSPDAAAAESFAVNDPYVKNGLVLQWQVRPWHVVIGGDDR